MVKRGSRTRGRSLTLPRSAADWEEAALSSIAACGLPSLSIPDLARSLGVTKGSFYWHFRGIGGLIANALRRWEEMDRVTLDELRRIKAPRSRLTALFKQAMEERAAHALYVALSAAPDPEVSAAIRRISDRRIRFLVEAYQDLGLRSAAAAERALLAYSAYVGALHLRQQRWPGLATQSHLAAYVVHAVKTLIPVQRRRA